MERVEQTLCKRRKNNPCLLGDPGVGKTVIAEGLAQKIVNATVPLKLKEKKVSKASLIIPFAFFFITLRKKIYSSL